MKYIEYKYNGKKLLKFVAVKYPSSCIKCGKLTTRKLLQGNTLGRELFRGIQTDVKSNNYYGAGFICSETCIKTLMFQHSLKGNIKLRKLVEEWLNAPPQEYFRTFENGRALVRVIKNAKPIKKGDIKPVDYPHFVEFYERTNTYSSSKNIQFFASTAWIKQTFSGIVNLLKEEKVEETNA
jgi:hypothetical protein